FSKLINQLKNPTFSAKSLFLNKFLSASPPMDVHSTAFQNRCKHFQKLNYSVVLFLNFNASNSLIYII
ncbi:hypothetical protein, partial [Acinetobacter sp. TUM15512]|uniref:hypothetical protein n=1 Tax=Acinetobacter sp. TUM15512 TaxID=2609155 RepID=UPI001C09A002